MINVVIKVAVPEIVFALRLEKVFCMRMPNGHEEASIPPENESQLWERRLRRDVGVAPTKYVDDFHGNILPLEKEL